MVNPPIVKQNEIYNLLFSEGERYLYYLSGNGYAFKVDKKTNVKTKVTPYGAGKLFVKINNKEYLLSKIIAKAFHSRYFDEAIHIVRFRDKNYKNCHINNLYYVTKRELGKKTGHLAHRSMPVVVKEYRQDPMVFQSVRKAAKYLHCSYQTLLDYLNNDVKRSVLKKYGRKIYYKNKEDKIE